MKIRSELMGESVHFVQSRRRLVAKWMQKDDSLYGLVLPVKDTSAHPCGIALMARDSQSSLSFIDSQMNDLKENSNAGCFFWVL